MLRIFQWHFGCTYDNSDGNLLPCTTIDGIQYDCVNALPVDGEAGQSDGDFTCEGICSSDCGLVGLA